MHTVSEWHPLTILAKLIPPTQEPTKAQLDAEAKVKADKESAESTDASIDLDAILETAAAQPTQASIKVSVPVATPVDKVQSLATKKTPSNVTGLVSLAQKASLPEGGAYSTAVSLADEAEAAVRENVAVGQIVDPFTVEAVADRMGTNKRWVLETPAEQGEIDFGRQAWGFVDPDATGPGKIILSLNDVNALMTGVKSYAGDTDEDGYRITPEIVEATGPSPAGSTYYRDALQCERRLALRYFFGLIPQSEPPWLLAGTVIHRAIAYYWANQMLEPPSWHNPSLHALEAELLRLAPHNPDLVREALTISLEYERYYATGGHLNEHPKRRRVRQDREWHAFSVEQIYSTTIDELDPPNKIDEQVERGERQPPSAEEMAVGKAIVTIRPDVLVRPIAQPDTIILVDHKTEGDDWTGGFKKKSLKVWEGDDKYATHFQFFVYLRVLRVLFGDRVQRAPVVQRVRRTAPFQMHRHECQIDARKLYDLTPSILRKGAARAAHAKEMSKKTIWLPVDSMPCYGTGFPCSYIDLCSARDDETAANIIAGRFQRIG